MRKLTPREKQQKFEEEKAEQLIRAGKSVDEIGETLFQDSLENNGKTLSEKILNRTFPGNAEYLTSNDKNSAYDSFLKNFKNTSFLGFFMKKKRITYTDIEFAHKLIEMNYASNFEEARKLTPELKKFRGLKFQFYPFTPRGNRPTYELIHKSSLG